MILPAFWRSFQHRTIYALYGMIVAQARSVTFYADYGVPDTVEGRFELIVLHLVLLLNRLDRESEQGRANFGRSFGQRLFDLFCQDLDHNLREMGVGDLAVPKKMRRFGEAFYGRQTVYLAALAGGDGSELEKAVARNIFGVVGVDDRAVRLARYARAAGRQLETANGAALSAGDVTFPSPEAFAHG
jgi:cytochrome b pre-mRNA-processing protein 3